MAIRPPENPAPLNPKHGSSGICILWGSGVVIVSAGGVELYYHAEPPLPWSLSAHCKHNSWSKSFQQVAIYLITPTVAARIFNGAMAPHTSLGSAPDHKCFLRCTIAPIYQLIAEIKLWTERSPSPKEKRLHFLAHLWSQSEFKTER